MKKNNTIFLVFIAMLSDNLDKFYPLQKRKNIEKSSSYCGTRTHGILRNWCIDE